MSIQFGKINNNIFVNSTATYENGIVSISSPENAEKINFYAPSNANDSDLYEINGKQVILSNILNNNPEITWVKGAPISAVYNSDNNKLFINGINGENSVFSNLFRNANAQVVESKVVINSVEEAVDLFNFYSPKVYSANDIYEVNGQVYDVVDLQGNKLESGWNSDVPVSLVLNENKLWYSSNGSDTKLPSDLSPLCPNFVVERKGTKVKISADKIQLNSLTDMVSGGVWAWGKTRPTKPTGENTKLWSRAELITTGKPYDGLYLGDVVPSDAVTETLLWLPENSGGSVVLVPFLVLSVDYLGGVYVMREPLSESMKATWGGSFYYPGNPVDSFLSATYLNSILDKSISDALLTCSVPVQTKSSTAVETMDRKCWVPSYGELYGATFNDGTKMPYFNSTNRIAYINGGKVKGAYWTRTREKGGSPYSVDTSGGMSNAYGWSDTIYVRPSFVLPKDFQIQKRPDGSYTVWNEQGLITLKDIQPSTSSDKIVINLLENSGNASYLYLSKNYNDSDRGLIQRENIPFEQELSNPYYTSGLSNVIVQWCQNNIDVSVQSLVEDVSFKYMKSTHVSGREYSFSPADYTAKYFALSASEMGGSDIGTGTVIPYFEDIPLNRVKTYNGTAKTYFTRDIASQTAINTASFYTVSASGSISSDWYDIAYGNVPAFTLPLTAPIRALADGTYDLVPEDPALAQSISTLADEEEVPLEVELDWPESDPLYARQWVYNEKGVYQTMLLGGVASDIPSGNLRLGDMPLETLVKSGNIWGEPIIWKIADINHEGYPDNSTTLITDKLIAVLPADAKEATNPNFDRKQYGNNRYIWTNINQWLNSDKPSGGWYISQHEYDAPPTNENVYDNYNEYSDWEGFLAMLDPKFVAKLIPTTLTVAKSSVDGGESETFTAKMFLPSNTEVGVQNGNDIVEGKVFPIFSDNSSRIAYPTEGCVNKSEDKSIKPSKDWFWWLRTASFSRSNQLRMIFPGGSLSADVVSKGNVGIRPLCNISADTLLDPNPNADGSYNIVF